MKTYCVQTNALKVTLKQRALLVLLFSGLYFALMFGWKFFWFSPYERREGLYAIAVEVAFISLLWGMVMSWLPRKMPNCKLLVDDQSMTGVMEYTGWMKWFVIRKTVSKGKVRSIREIRGRLGTPGGLAVSARSGWEAWMWGGVFISKSLPEYDELKTLVEGWRVGA